MSRARVIWVIVVLAAHTIARKEANGEQLLTAMYVFGDSMSDPGNNNYFIDSIAKADFWPYGVDFTSGPTEIFSNGSSGPTGRFCNGKIIVDFLAEALGLPLLPSYANTIKKDDNILSGVNYASAGAGILEGTGHTFGKVIPFPGQIANFENTLNQLRYQIQGNELSNYLAKALAFVDIGTNDYLNNYLQPMFYKSSKIYTPQQFALLLINRYSAYVLRLRDLGLRKFYLVELPPFGCSPIALTLFFPGAPPGVCDQRSNNLVQMFNTKLKSLVDQLNLDYPDSVFSRGATFQLFFDFLNNADTYGIRVTDAACCGIGRDKGSKFLCLPNLVPCFNRDEYLFWDAAHLTEATNRVLSPAIFNATAYSFPLTILQMAGITK